MEMLNKCLNLRVALIYSVAFAQLSLGVLFSLLSDFISYSWWRRWHTVWFIYQVPWLLPANYHIIIVSRPKPPRSVETGFFFGV